MDEILLVGARCPAEGARRRHLQGGFDGAVTQNIPYYIRYQQQEQQEKIWICKLHSIDH